MGISDEDALRMRAAAMQKALDGDVEGALNIAAIHDVVTGKSKGGKDSGGDKGKGGKKK